LRAVLVREGHEVHTAGTSQEALEICSCSASFDLVLSAVDMPVMDGHDLARSIAARSPGSRVMLMYALDAGCDACPHSPHCGLVKKPFDPKEIVSRIAAELTQPPRPSVETSPAVHFYVQISSHLRRQLSEARATFDSASNSLSRLNWIQSDEAIGNDFARLLQEAKRVHRAAHQVYASALQRYSDHIVD
jgi:CheY-like chemotaxis protein